MSTEDMSVDELIAYAERETACHCKSGGVVNPLTCAEHGDQDAYIIAQMGKALQDQKDFIAAWREAYYTLKKINDTAIDMMRILTR